MRRKDLTGKRYGRLIVLGLTERRTKSGNAVWLCKCDCGTEKEVSTDKLTNGNTRSCGCLARDITRARVKGKAFHVTHNGSNDRLYGIWRGMIERCENPHVSNYSHYGGEGVKVCEEWRNHYDNFKVFALTHGYEETAKRGKYTIDRIDVNGDYCPENCRLVDMKQQQNNRGNNHRLTYNGETKTVAQWADLLGIRPGTLYSRIYRGWTVERALEKC